MDRLILSMPKTAVSSLKWNASTTRSIVAVGDWDGALHLIPTGLASSSISPASHTYNNWVRVASSSWDIRRFLMVHR